MVRTFVGFVIGAVTMLIAWYGIQFAQTARASPDEQGELSSLIPDIVQINREALVTPLREAEKSIWDKDVASYYHLLLGRMDFLEDPAPTSSQVKSLYDLK